MELRVLDYFLVVAREENITKAASLLHVSQPTLSRQIANLEQELGTKLFIRKSHQIRLTSDGLLLRRRAEEMHQLSQKIYDEISFDQSELSGEISIGSGELRGMNELGDIMVKFHRKYPLVTFNIQSGNSHDIKFGIERGLLDMGILIEPVDTQKYHFVPLAETETWGALVRNDSPLKNLPYITPKDLQNQDLIMSHSQKMQEQINQWLGKYAQSISYVSTYNLLYNSAILVKNGLGIALGLDLEAEYKDLTFIPLKSKQVYHSVLAWKADEISSKSVTTFLKFAEKYLNDISNDEK